MPLKNKIAAIILAAGGSTRMGKPKLTMDWHGFPLVRWVARIALHAGCAPVIVVSGASPDALKTSLAGLPVQFAHNPDWESGQSTSVRAGVLALPEEVDSALILLGDQPQIPLTVLHALINAYCTETPPPPILAAAIGKQRVNPVLFDRAMFPVLTSLEGDAGARTIFSRYPVQLIPFDIPDLKLDVDSPEDYQRLMKLPPPELPPESKPE
mgnify:CR=1 FL=1